MITGIFVFGEKLYTATTVNTVKLSSIQLQGYNFDKLQNVMLSCTDTTALPSLTTVNIFKRQQPITGCLVDYTVIDKNNLIVKIPRFLIECQIQLIPFNVAGYSESNNTLFSPNLSANKTIINVNIPVISTYRRPLSTATYRRPDGSDIYLRE